MSKWTFIPNLAGFEELRNSPEMQAILREHGSRIARSATSFGGAYGCDVQAGKNRAHARVFAKDSKAAHASYKHNALVKAMGGK